MSFLMNMFLEGFVYSNSWVESLVTWLKKFVVPVLIVIAAVGAFYAIFCGVKLATAETADARQEAQKKLIYIFIALIVTIIVVIILFALPSVLQTIFNDNELNLDTNSSSIIKVAKTFIKC